ncbi:DUF5808 domain-containing protein [Flavobacterium muglaense]|uniref:DUF5808 domain-containing protein n=1 Tax=Flavobacterium muglaense TaxID=2764716 RepID=A0A923MYY3_9FLAO|nr:DUF5808 domain-containing protein [Flavobacterium muglaense]MBC5837090.1 hypothetical protein [Flavobacterium muglaense]MBC5843619.1 hypothetical protein [Flavobacterium muglaense]
MENNKPSKETLEKWHQDPNNWVLGIFYFNREDPRIFPPKRMAWAGWTVNFANPKSVGVLLALLALAIAASTIFKK